MSRSFVTPGKRFSDEARLSFASFSSLVAFWSLVEAWVAPPWAFVWAFAVLDSSASAWVFASFSKSSCSAFLASAFWASANFFVASPRVASFVAKSDLALLRSFVTPATFPLEASRVDWAVCSAFFFFFKSSEAWFAAVWASDKLLSACFSVAVAWSKLVVACSNCSAFLASARLAAFKASVASLKVTSFVAKSDLALSRSSKTAFAPVPSKTAWALSLFCLATLSWDVASLWACVAFERVSVAWSKVFFCPASSSFASLNLRAFVASAFCDCSRTFLASFTIACLASKSFLASFSSLITLSAPVPFKTSWAFWTFFLASATFPACFWVASVAFLTTVSCASFFSCACFCCSFKGSIFSVCVVTSFLEASISFFVPSIASGVAAFFFWVAWSSACLALSSAPAVIASCSLALSTTGVWASTAWSAWSLIFFASWTISSVGAFVTRAVPFETSTPSTWVMAVVDEVCTCFSSATVLPVDFTSTCSSAFAESVEKLVNATPAAKARVIFLFFLLFLDFIFTHINLKRISPNSKSFI